MDFSTVLAGVAGVLGIVGFIIYNRKPSDSSFRPSIATWGIWAFVAVLNLRSYSAMSKDLVTSILPAIGTLFCIATFIGVIFRGKITALKCYDIASLALGIAGVVAGKLWSSTHANLVVQGALAIGYVPTYVIVVKSPKEERSLPWFVWAGAYLMQLFVIGLRWQGNYAVLAYPVLEAANCLCVGLLARRAMRGKINPA